MYRLCLVALALAGCAADVDNANCQRYGFEPGTDGYANCRMVADQNRRTGAAAVMAQNPYRLGY